MTAQDDSIWRHSYKIPWDDPDFSRRMLLEHLTQGHDMASLRTEWIDRQVAWIHTELLGGRPGSVLDLGCGPGFYSHRLTKRGHQCCGMDFGPASIKYAREHNPDMSRCDFVLGDVRHVSFGGPYNLAMILYGEFNVFAPAEISAILDKAQASLCSQGILVIEAQTVEAVERVGSGDPSEKQHESGLFSDHPHNYRTENQWLPDQEVAIQTFTITEEADRQTRVYRSTTKACPNRDLMELLIGAGLRDIKVRDDWPCNTDDLKLWVATKA